MAIHVITGRPRHGKTLFMTQIAIKRLKRGERVFSNLKLNLGIGALKKFNEEIIGDWSKQEDRNNPKKILFYWENMHDWEHFEKGVIICDEMQRYFNARQWAQLSPETEIKLQQHGKEDLDIYGTTQYYDRIDITLRVLVEIWYDITTIFGSPDNNKIFLGLKLFKIVGIEGIEYFEPFQKMKINPELKLQIPMTSKIRLFRKKYAICYDTKAKVKKSLPMPLMHTERTCEICGETKILHA